MPSSNTYYSFRDVEHYGNPSLIDNIEVSLKHYFDWALLEIGAWQQVQTTTSGTYGGNFATLHDTFTRGRGSNTEYQSIRKDWVYETGVNYNSPKLDIDTITYSADQEYAYINLKSYENAYFSSGDQIVVQSATRYNGSYNVYSGGLATIMIDNTPGAAVSGVDSLGAFDTGAAFFAEYSSGILATGGTINGVYNPLLPTIYVNGIENTDNTINYPHGKVVFDSALNNGDVVTATYSFRNVQTYISDQTPWIYELQYDTMDPSDLQWTQNLDSGNFSPNSSKRVQLPAILIETVNNGTSTPFQLGSLTARLKQDIICHVVSQNKFERNNITDILRKLHDKTIWLYDQYELGKRNYNSLNYDGSVNSNGLVYKDIVQNNDLRWRKAYFDSVNISAVETKTPNLHMSKVRFTIEVID